MDEFERHLTEEGLIDVFVTEEDFLDMLPPYLAIALQENLEPVFHVFSDNRDMWVQDTHVAYEMFRLWAMKYDAARLYIELYEDRENDVMVHEDCLLSVGSYPI